MFSVGLVWLTSSLIWLWLWLWIVGWIVGCTWLVVVGEYQGLASIETGSEEEYETSYHDASE